VAGDWAVSFGCAFHDLGSSGVRFKFRDSRRNAKLFLLLNRILTLGGAQQAEEVSFQKSIEGQNQRHFEKEAGDPSSGSSRISCDIPFESLIACDSIS
jgi:hypothetical protein